MAHRVDPALCMCDLESAPLSTVLALAPSLLQHPATQSSTTAALLCRLPLEEPAGARRLLQVLCAYGVRGGEVSEQLLELLPLLRPAVLHDVLDTVPQLLGDSPDESEAFLSVARQLMAADRTLLLPAIGALGEVAWPEHLKPELSRLALGALPLADEADLPTLARSLMLSLSASSAGRVLRAMRQHLGDVRTDTLSLLLQVVCNTLRVNSGATKVLLRLCTTAAALTRWDCLLLLNLLQLPRHAAAVTQALGRSLRSGALALSTLHECTQDPTLFAAAVPHVPALAAELLAMPSAAARAAAAALARVRYMSDHHTKFSRLTDPDTNITRLGS